MSVRSIISKFLPPPLRLHTENGDSMGTVQSIVGLVTMSFLKRP